VRAAFVRDDPRPHCTLGTSPDGLGFYGPSRPVNLEISSFTIPLTKSIEPVAVLDLWDSLCIDQFLFSGLRRIGLGYYTLHFSWFRKLHLYPEVESHGEGDQLGGAELGEFAA
jgi:hypothetical protein